MSDGNFHRSLLPHTPYQSGLKMGKALATKSAVEAFRKYIKETTPTLTEEETEREVERFSTLLYSQSEHHH